MNTIAVDSPGQGNVCRKRGIVTAIKPLHGFGFALTPDRRSYYFKFRELEDALVPKIGETVSFVVGQDREGHPIATKVRVEPEGGSR
jgi:cold shock CspA family protein